jgi:hypothetical protein
METARAGPGEILGQAPLDDDDIDAGQGQLAGEHQPRRAAAGDHRRMLGSSGD